MAYLAEPNEVWEQQPVVADWARVEPEGSLRIGSGSFGYKWKDHACYAPGVWIKYEWREETT